MPSVQIPKYGKDTDYRGVLELTAKAVAIPAQQILSQWVCQESINTNRDIRTVLNGRVLKGLVDQLKVNECNYEEKIYVGNKVVILGYRICDHGRSGDKCPVLYLKHVAIALIDKRKCLSKVFSEYLDRIHFAPKRTISAADTPRFEPGTCRSRVHQSEELNPSQVSPVS